MPFLALYASPVIGCAFVYSAITCLLYERTAQNAYSTLHCSMYRAPYLFFPHRRLLLPFFKPMSAPDKKVDDSAGQVNATDLTHWLVRDWDDGSERYKLLILLVFV